MAPLTTVDEHVTRASIAVIIPFYNGAAWIERAIKSVVAQSVQADEFIIVNDGSEQTERDILGQLALIYSFQIIDKQNGGQGSARNAGVNATKSEYISLLDQDDFYLINHIRDLVGVLPKDDPRVGYVYADLCEAEEDGSIVCSNMLRRLPAKHPKRGHVVHLVGYDMFVLPSASLIVRTAFEAIGGFDEQFTGYEDDDFFLRLFRAGYTNYFLDKPVTVWCIHSASTSYGIKMSRSRLKYFKKLVSLYKDDASRELFYFRNSLMPRFGRQIILESLRAAILNSAQRPELSSILKEYAEFVYANPTVPLVKKLRLRFIAAILIHAPSVVVKILSSVNKRMNIVRRISAALVRA